MNHVLLAVTGPSGVGKTTLMRRTGLPEVKSFTTRAPREGEVNGVDYKFIDVERFVEMQDNNELVEYVEYDGNFYGIEKSEFDKLKDGPAFVIVEYGGYLQVKEYYEKTYGIFIKMDKADAILGMVERGDSADKIKRRIAKYDEEVKNSRDYNAVVTNCRGHLFRALGEIFQNLDIAITHMGGSES